MPAWEPVSVWLKFAAQARALVDAAERLRRGIITEGYRGVLRSVPGLPRPPFEVTFETPQTAPVHRQVEAFNAALKTMLVEYRYLIAIAQDI